MPTPVNDKKKNIAWDRTKGRCGYCGVKLTTGNVYDTKQFTVDHIIPMAKGGDHESSNLLAACRHCNGSKKTRDLEEWRNWHRWKDICEELGFSSIQLAWLLENTNFAEVNKRNEHVFFFEKLEVKK